MPDLYDATAPWYDVAHDALVDHDADVALLEESFRAHARRAVARVLDLGCGTGSHALRLAARGFDVDALDASEGMLAVARAKAAGAANPRWHRADMAAWLPDGPFDAVVSLNASFNYVTDDARAAALVGALAERVPPGGLLVVELWSPRVREGATWDRHADAEGREVLRLKDVAVALGVVHMSLETLVLRGARVETRVREPHRLRARTQDEARALLAPAFEVVAFTESVRRGKTLASAPREAARYLAHAVRIDGPA